VVAATAELITAGRLASVPVVFTTILYSVAEIDGGGVAWLRKAPGMRVLLERHGGRRGGRPAAQDQRGPCDQQEGASASSAPGWRPCWPGCGWTPC